MDDEYVNIFLWNNQVTSLPTVKFKSVRKIFPVFGGIVQGVLTSAFDPCSLLRGLLERNLRDALIDVFQRFYF